MKTPTESSDECEMSCPLCLEELDLDEQEFYPCTCDYQICKFCYQKIRESDLPRCPACRTTYNDDNITYKPLPQYKADLIISSKKNSSKLKKDSSGSKRNLANMRVIQKNLVYVIGLGSKYANEEVLKQPNLFGQYGKINKIVFSKKPTGTGPNSTIGAYITYAKAEDAAKAIAAVNGMKYDGRVIKAMVGSTKYCLHYLQNQPCTSPGCMYLHEPAEEAEPADKEELSSKISKQSLPLPPTSDKTVSKKTSLPVTKSTASDKATKYGGSALPSGASWAKAVHPHSGNESNMKSDNTSSFNIRESFPPAPGGSHTSPTLTSKSHHSVSSSPEYNYADRRPEGSEPSNSFIQNHASQVPGATMDFASFLNLASKDVEPDFPVSQNDHNDSHQNIPDTSSLRELEYGPISGIKHGSSSSISTSQVLAALSQSLNLNDPGRYNSSSYLTNLLKQPLKTYQGPFNPFGADMDTPIGGISSNHQNGYFQSGFDNSEYAYSTNSNVGLGPVPSSKSPNMIQNSLNNGNYGSGESLNNHGAYSNARSFSQSSLSKPPGYLGPSQPGVASRGFNPFEQVDDNMKAGGPTKPGSHPPGLLSSRSASFESNVAGGRFDPFGGSGDGYAFKNAMSNLNPMAVNASVAGAYTNSHGVHNYFKPGMEFEGESGSFSAGRPYSNMPNIPQPHSSFVNNVNIGRPARPY